MFDFNPFISNDGSVGLYSKEDNDIYHSVYGALSESYEKFVLPANLEYYLKTKNKINFLDICYGIGYNTKSLIQFLMNNFSYEKNTVYSIYTDKTITKKNINNTETIYTDKILYNKNNETKNKYNDLVDADKIEKKKLDKEPKLYNETIDNDKNSCKFSIDAVDLNKNLMMLSPFIKNKFDYKNILEIDLPEAKKAKKNLKPLKIKDEYMISNLVLKLLFDEVMNSDFVDYNFLIDILNNKNYNQIFSNDYKAHFRHFIFEHDINYPQKDFLLFLHNIYYRYVSKRYLNGLKSPIDKLFDVNLFNMSAVDMLASSNKVYDVVFLDAFTPAKCPKLWTIDFIKLIYQHLSDDGIVLTYSNSAQVRNAFLNAGFYIGKNFSEENNKAYGTIASKSDNLIKYKLNDFELGLLNTRAGIYFRDNDFSLTDEEIISQHKTDVENSNLISSSKYIKFNSNRV